MPALDADTRIELDRRIEAAGYSGYAAHAGWLASAGHIVSLTALKRYGERLQSRAEADKARAIEARLRHTREELDSIAPGDGIKPLVVLTARLIRNMAAKAAEAAPQCAVSSG